MERQRNHSLDLIRFLLCCVICLYHLSNMNGRLFRSGYLSVDLFFVMSGCFLMRHFYCDHSQESPEKQAINYLKNRLWRIIPHHLFSWIIMVFVCVFLLNKYTFAEIPLGWSELLLLKSTGVGNNISINGVVWYLSSLILCSYLIYWVLCTERKHGIVNGTRFTCIIAPLCFFLVMSHIWYTRGNLSYAGQKAVIFTGGFLRGISEISLGCTTFAVANYIRHKHQALTKTKTMRFFASMFEAVGWLVVFFIMNTKGGKKDFIVPVLGSALLISMLSIDSYLSILFNHKICGYLGRLSFAMFLNQLIIINPMKKMYAHRPLWQMGIIMLVGLMILSAFSDWLVGKCIAAAHRISEGNKKRLDDEIKEDVSAESKQ